MDRDTQEEWRRKETQIDCRRQQAEFVVLISCIERWRDDFRGQRWFNSSITHTVCGIRMEERIERKTLSYEIILERRRRSRYRKERRSTLSQDRLGQWPHGHALQERIVAPEWPKHQSSRHNHLAFSQGSRKKAELLHGHYRATGHSVAGKCGALQDSIQVAGAR